MLGGPEVRARFLAGKVQREVEVLGRLRSLARQDALLLLTKSLQHTLRHLLRTLKTDDLDSPWRELDAALHDALVFIRGSEAHEKQLDRILFSLPVRLGGSGVPCFSDIFPHARAAMRAESDFTLTERKLLRPWRDLEAARVAEVDEDAEAARGPRQHERLQPLWAHMMAQLGTGVDDQPAILSFPQLLSVLGHSSPLGRRWRSLFPVDINTTLSDREVQVAIQLATLQPTPNHLCADCGQRAPHGHDDVCDMATHRRIARHNGAARFMAEGLKRISGTTVVREPHLIGDGHRTDLRVSGPGAPRGVLTEFDLTFISTASKHAQAIAHRTYRQQLADGKDPWTIARAVLAAITDEKAASKTSLYAQRLDQRGTAFTPLVFTLEGYAHQEAAAVLSHWRSTMHSFAYMMNAISVIMLHSRSESFVLRPY